MKTKALISFAVTAKLIFVFVFAYAKSRFSNDAAHMFKTDCDFKMSEISNIACRWVKTMPEPLKPRPLHVHGSFVFSVCKL